ncbi:type II 3-dehydroquinate dehydratase [uncultured Olsenella sp.]|uniref:type II 3-dehydroquinate dehydratase n=1 Tax=uncultured Olsenella sp. TaxID=190764 RepID=UPI0026DBF37A|nr:type II 3-dehydroquinate dehydratase [uncultured Olsenella sp.]
MTSRETASEVLDLVGGTPNVTANTLCMTRLRLVVRDPSLVDKNALCKVEGVLGIVGRGSDGIEVVFGPNSVGQVFESFAELTGLPASYETPFADLSHGGSPLQVSFTPSRRSSHPDVATPAADPVPRQVEAAVGERHSRPSFSDPAFRSHQAEGADEIEALLSGMDDATQADDFDGYEDEDGPRLLVINGPNINMLGIREPGIYGREDFAALLELCADAAREEGFAHCDCYQSNHEGDLVDAIQDAYGSADGIVINPAAYTHTSIALLDALKAVGIPAVEVHISRLEEREDFRQRSYVRAACIETVSGMGIGGYREAIRILADHLGITRG